MERKRLLIRASELYRERGEDAKVAKTLGSLSDANRHLGLYEEGIRQAKEALEIYIRLNDKSRQAKSWQRLAQLLFGDDQLDAAEEAISRALDLLPDEGDQFGVCKCHRLLGEIYQSKGETEKAIYHYEKALETANSFNWHHEQFWNHFALARLFLGESRFDDAHAHVERAKLHAIDHTYHLGQAVQLRARVWRREHRFEEAKFEILHAAHVFERVGAAKDLKRCRDTLRSIEREMERRSPPVSPWRLHYLLHMLISD